MKNDFITELLKSKYPDLLEKEKSIQREKSIEILNIRLDNNYSVKEFADILKLDEKEYLDYEFGSMNHSVSDYEMIINQANEHIKYLKNSIEISFKENFLNLFNLSEEKKYESDGNYIDVFKENLTCNNYIFIDSSILVPPVNNSAYSVIRVVTKQDNKKSKMGVASLNSEKLGDRWGKKHSVSIERRYQSVYN